MPSSGFTPEQRSLRGRLGAQKLHSQVDSRKHTQPARDAFDSKFDDEVDPDRTLSETERRRRAALAKKAYFTALALKSSRARSKAPVSAESIRPKPPPDATAQELTESAG